jgi:hypothetical protein
MKSGLDYYNMQLSARILEIKRMLKERGESTNGRQRDLVKRMVVEIEEDQREELDSDDWRWLLDMRDEIEMQEENKERKRIQSIYNKTLEDFDGALQEYNDYLEDVEHKIHQLAERENVEEVEAEVKIYQSENRDQIAIRESQKADEEKQLLARVAQEVADLEEMKRNARLEDHYDTVDSKILARQQMEVLLGERDEVTVTKRPPLIVKLGAANANANPVQYQAPHPLMMNTQEQPMPAPPPTTPVTFTRDLT